MKLHLRQGSKALPAIGFGMADAAVEVGDTLDIVFSAEENEWNGTTSLQLRLRDWRTAHPT